MRQVRLSVPFFANTKDNLHCFQAALSMVLAFFFPDRRWTFEELDEITGHSANYTWPTLGQLYCRSLGLRVKNIDVFDSRRFVSEGYAYLEEFAGRQVAEQQRINSDLPREIENIRQLLADPTIIVERRIPTRRDLHSALDAGGLVICHVNSAILANAKGYNGHFVVVTGMSNDGIWLHDPGLPSLESRFCEWGLFERAWGFPTAKMKGALVFLPENGAGKSQSP